MSYDFPVEWYDGVLREARDELKSYERIANGFKKPGTRHHQAHVLVVEMKRAALKAMEAIPRPLPESEAAKVVHQPISAEAPYPFGE
jgi:hypothetical protein